MTKDTTKEAASRRSLLLDDWFDAIEDGVRARARGFIETMLEEELPRRCRVRATAGASQVRTRRRHRLLACATGIASGR